MRVTATHLVKWSDKRETQGMLPVLIRRLISATACITQPDVMMMTVYGHKSHEDFNECWP